MFRQILTHSVFLCLALNAYAFAAETWTQFAGTSSRASIALDGPSHLDAEALEWVSGNDPWDPEFLIDFEWASTPVVHNGRVYAYAKYYDKSGTYTGNQIIAFDCATGEVVWAAVVERASGESWSSPSVDVARNLVLIGSGKKVYAVNAENGSVVWETQLDRPVVNASVCIADDLEYGRGFITDYNPYSEGGKMYCLNLDPNSPADNPYEPGDIVWSEQLGKTSGNTPAYKDGIVYVGCVGQGSWESEGTTRQGAISAYAADDDDPVRIWHTTSDKFEGFFGGVTVTNEGYVYAANYDFYGTGDNSAMCKLDAETGDVVWITQTERTNSIPVVVGDMIYVSGGLSGPYGSSAKITAFKDHGGSVTKLWETPSTMLVGERTSQLVFANGKLYAGARSPQDTSSDPFSLMYVLDADLTPADPNSIISKFTGCGGSCAVTVDSLYCLGGDGLHKFYQQAFAGDISGDGVVNSADLALLSEHWLQSFPLGVQRADLNLDGLIDIRDFAVFAKDRLESTK